MVSSDEIRRRLEAKRRGEDISQEKPVKEKTPEQATVNCPECQTPNPTSAKFCVGCGSALVQEEVTKTEPETQSMVDSKICPSCNQKNKVDAKFCIVCGHKFEEDAAEEDVESVTTVTEGETPIQPKDEVEKSVPEVETPEKISDQPPAESNETPVIPEIKVPDHLKSNGAEPGESETVEKIEEPEESKESVQTESFMAEETTDLQESAEEDIDPVEKIKKAKELLDIGAITQEEFDQIKNKYLEKI